MIRTARVARTFATTARACKINEKLKPKGAPEPLHVPGSGINHSSEIDRGHNSFLKTLASFAAPLLGRKQIFYSAFQPTMDMYVAAAGQAAQDKSTVHKMANQFWYESASLPPTFQTWFQITQLHIWLLMVRMRALPRGTGQHFQQEITNHFFNDAEARLRVVYQIRDGRIIQTYMKDLLLQWRGAVAAYDEALPSEDTVFAAALWRNMYSAQPDADLASLAAMVAHVRQNLQVLDNTPDEEFIKGTFSFYAPKAQ